MNKNATEAHRFYKEQYAPFIIFFRVGNFYNAYLEDAQNISSTLGIPIKDGCVKVPSDQILDIVGTLSQSGFHSKIITYRNDNGRYTIPDVTRLKKEMEMDK